LKLRLRGFAARQLFQIDDLFAASFGEAVETSGGAELEGKRHAEVRTCRRAVEHIEVVLVDTRFDRLATGVAKAVLDCEFRLVFGERQAFSIDVSVTGGIGQLLLELDPIGAAARSPFAAVDDFVSGELSEGGLVRLADGAYTNLYERPARLGFRVAEPLAVGQEFFNRAGDRVVNFRVVAVEPFAEVFVAVPLEARYRTGPVEACRAVVAVVGVGKVELGVDLGTCNFGLGRVGGEGNSGEQNGRQQPHSVVQSCDGLDAAH
jgi:hypothetical protein